MLTLLFALNVLISNCPSVGDSEAFKKEMREAFHTEKFEKLEATLKCVRTETPRFESGEWVLASFYAGVDGNLDDGSEFSQKIQKYKKLFPQSAIPFVLESNAYLKLAWKSRGSGYASKVNDKSWDGFFENLKLSWSAILKARDMDKNNPQIIAAMIEIAYPINLPLPEISKIFQIGVNIQRNYYPLYYVHSEYLLPKWYGRTDKDAEIFAKASAEMTKASDGDSLYSKIAGKLAANYGEKVFTKHNFDWKIVKNGFEEYLKRFPTSQNDLVAFCFLASVSKDKATAAPIFTKLGEEWDNFKKTFFNSSQKYQAYRNWALKNQPYPEDDDLHSAIKSRNIAMALSLINPSNVNALDSNSLSPLILAVDNSLFPVVAELIKKGADPSIGTYKGISALHLSAERGSAENLREILKTGISVNTLDSYQWTALHRASARNKVAVVDVLIERTDTDVNIQAPDGQTALSMAISMNYDEVVEHLLKSKKIDVNRPRKDNWAPLHLAAWYGNEKIIKMLVKAGANKELKAGNGLNAEQIAEKKSFPHLASLIRDLN